MMTSRSPAFQHSTWIRRIGALESVFKAVVYHRADAVLRVIVDISRTRAGVTKVIAAVGGGCSGSKPENEHEGIQCELTPDDPWQEFEYLMRARGEEEVDEDEEGEN